MQVMRAARSWESGQFSLGTDRRMGRLPASEPMQERLTRSLFRTMHPYNNLDAYRLNKDATLIFMFQLNLLSDPARQSQDRKCAAPLWGEESTQRSVHSWFRNIRVRYALLLTAAMLESRRLRVSSRSASLSASRCSNVVMYSFLRSLKRRAPILFLGRTIYLHQRAFEMSRREETDLSCFLAFALSF